MFNNDLRWFAKITTCTLVLSIAFWGHRIHGQTEGEDSQPAAGGVSGSELFRVMKKEKDALEKKLQDMRLEMRTREEQLAEVQQANQDLRGTIDKLQTQLAGSQQDVEAVQATLKRARMDDEKALAVLEQERARARQLADVIQELRNLVSRQAQAIDAQNTQLAQLQAERRGSERQAQEALARAQAAERRAQDADERYEATRHALQETRADMHYNMGVIYGRNHNYRAAENEYLTCLQLNPDDPAAHYNLGILYQDVLHKPQKALHHYRQFIAMASDSEDREKVEAWIAAIMAEQQEQE